MSVEVQYFYLNSDGQRIRGKMTMEAPGTVVTSDLAVTINKNFLHWAQSDLRRETLVHAIAIDRSTGREIFRTQFLGGEDGLSSHPENAKRGG